MKADQIDTIVRKHLERLDEAVYEILANADLEALKEIKEDRPFWIDLMNIDIDMHIEAAEG